MVVEATKHTYVLQNCVSSSFGCALRALTMIQPDETTHARQETSNQNKKGNHHRVGRSWPLLEPLIRDNTITVAVVKLCKCTPFPITPIVCCRALPVLHPYDSKKLLKIRPVLCCRCDTFNSVNKLQSLMRFAPKV